MSSMTQFQDQSWTFWQGAIHVISDETNKGYRWCHGEWDGPYGNVWWSVGGKSDDQFTNIRITMDHISYHRRWETMFGFKTIARLCREFQEEVYIKTKLRSLGIELADLERFGNIAYTCSKAAPFISDRDSNLIQKYILKE